MARPRGERVSPLAVDEVLEPPAVADLAFGELVVAALEGVGASLELDPQGGGELAKIGVRVKCYYAEGIE